MGWLKDTWNAGVDMAGDAWNAGTEMVTGVGRTNMGNVAGSVAHGDLDAAEKEYEKGIVRAAASRKKKKLKELKSDNDERFDSAIEDISSSSSTIGDQLDEDIKGQFSKQIKTTITTETTNLGKLVTGGD